MARKPLKRMKPFTWLRYISEFILLMVFNLIIFLIPWWLSWRLGRFMGWFAYRFIPKRKTVVRKNLARAFPEKKETEREHIVEQCYMHWGEGFISTLKLWIISKRKVRSLVTVSNLDDYVADAQSAKEPILYFTGHFGSWEMAGRYVGGIGPGAASIYRIQKNPLVNWYLTWIREYHQVRLINSWSGMPAFEEALKTYGGLAVVGDQYKSKHGITVDFFGIPSKTPRGAALLTWRLKPRLVFLDSIQKRGHYEISIEEIPYTCPEELNDEWVRDLIQTLTSRLEAKIRQYPEQYFWFHQRWRDLDREDKK